MFWPHKTDPAGARDSIQDAGHVCQVKKRANMIDKKLPRKFIGWFDAIVIFIVWLALMTAMFMGVNYVFKHALGIYALQERVDRLEYRLDHMQAE